MSKWHKKQMSAPGSTLRFMNPPRLGAEGQKSLVIQGKGQAGNLQGLCLWMKFLLGKDLVLHLIFSIQVCFEILIQNFPISHGVTHQGQNTNSDFMNYTHSFSLFGWEGKSRQFRKRYGVFLH